jgi:hypothetical protein
MSTNEQMLLIGRLSTERTTARREMALVGRKIIDGGDALYKIGMVLMRSGIRIDGLVEGSGLIETALRRGDLKDLHQSIEEYRSLNSRVDELSESLRQAGAE